MTDGQLKCSNGDEDSEHTEGLVECRSCATVFCAPCREAISGSKDKCPACGGYVGEDPSCRLNGGCGR